MDTYEYKNPTTYSPMADFTPKRRRAPVPQAFIIITAIVGGFWFVYQQGGFEFFGLGDSSIPETVQEELLPGALLFFAKAPIVQDGGAEIYGIAVHSDDGTVSDILPVTEERFISAAAIAPTRDAALIITNQFARETSSVSVVAFDEENTTQVLVESTPVASIFFSDPLWAGDGTSVVFGRNTFNPDAAPEEVVTKPIRREMVRINLATGDTAVIGEGIPLALSYDGEQVLSLDSTNTLVMTNREGGQREITTLEPFTHFVTKLSPDAQTLVILRDDETIIATIDWDTARFSRFVSTNAIHMDAAFDQYGNLLLVSPDGLLHAHSRVEGEFVRKDTYRTAPPFVDETAVFLAWINTQQP